MNIYLASAFDLIPEVQVAAAHLERNGHHIVVKWWSTDGFNMWDKKTDLTTDSFYQDPICGKIFETDLEGVKRADALVLVCGKTARRFNGANVEYGIALALGKPCYSVGQLDNSAMYHPIRKCKSLRELDSHLGMVCPECGSRMDEETLGFGGGGRSFVYGFRCSNKSCRFLRSDEVCSSPEPVWSKLREGYYCENCGHPVAVKGVAYNWEHRRS